MAEIGQGHRVLHDRVASTLALARTVLMGIDESKTHQSVQTESLKLLLNTLLDLGAPNLHPKVAESARKSVESMMMPKVLDEQRGTGNGWI